MKSDRDHIANWPTGRKALFVYYAMRVVTAGAGIWFLFARQWQQGITSLAIALVMSVPSLVRRARIWLPFSLDFGIVAFIFLTLFLGQVQDFYTLIPPWDKFVHFQSGILFAVMGFVVVYVLNERERGTVRLSPGFVALFAACFAIALGAVWEIGEFAADVAFSTDYWQPGLTDTMLDLIADTSGAIIIAGIGYAWMWSATRLPLTPARFWFGRRKK